MNNMPEHKPDISFDYYKVFYEVAKKKNITLAAQQLCLTQPTISKCIQNLEHDLDCRLFFRSQKGVTLTPEGQLLFRQVSRACQQMERARGMLKEYVDGQSGKINIGASELTMRYFLLPYLEQFQHRYPNINIRIHSFSAQMSISALMAGTLDFALLTTPLEEQKGAFITQVSDFQDIVVAGNHFTHLLDHTLSLKDLLQYPLVCMEQGTTSRQFWDDIFQKQGLELHPNIEVNSNDLIPPTVLHNLGIGFVPYKFARSYLLNCGLIQLSLDLQIPRRHICIVQNPKKELPIATKALLHLLEEANEDTLARYSADAGIAF